MTNPVDVAALVRLARLDISTEETARLEKEIPEILGFVETIQQVSADVPVEIPSHRNVMREDKEPHAAGAYTRDLIDAAPAHVDDYVAVKQVISKK